ncbi:S8 family peptidase [Metabacillus litoralis]|uniref:S8 family peptidase n=1 Tax=Metabacillus litoralis TaxID=152268 RepID=A0A5C6W0U1_9BACI|nr:S8 family peptidase [Metabacillus litoralis]TXC90956.1 S8 family peptidase [Metabacillus litoralis]
MHSHLKYSLQTIIIFILLSLGYSNTHAQELVEEQYEKVTVLFNDKVDHTLIPTDRITYYFDTLPAYSALLTLNEIEALRKNQDIKLVNIDKPGITISSTQSIDWGHDAIGVPQMQRASLTGKNIKIAILDTGIDRFHPDLNVSGGKNFIDNTEDYKDENGHGTHVAGIIASLNNDIGTLGVAYSSSIYALKILDANGEGSTTELANAIDWAIEQKMDILNMSFGFSGSDPIISELLNKAYKNNILLVGAAGNEGVNSINFPANNRNVIAVGAVNIKKQLANFSNTGSQLEVTAPGVRVRSTYLNNQYKYMDGTSMATPYVTGYLALLKEKHPTKTNEEIRSLLLKNVEDLGVTGRDTVYGYGLIQSFISEEKDPEPILVDAPYFKALEDKLPVYDNRSGSLVNVGYLEKGQIYQIERHYTSWYQIRFGSYSAFVRKTNTLPLSSHNLNNLTNTSNTTNREFLALNDSIVLDNTSGSLVPFGIIKSGTTYAISTNYTNWIGVNFGGRIGYVQKNDITIKFNSSDQFFTVSSDHVPILSNRFDSNTKVGVLNKGEVYRRIKEIDQWHEIQYGNKSVYIQKDYTTVAFSHSLKNLSGNNYSIDRTFIANEDIEVYDNTSGQLVPFATLFAGEKLPIVKEYSGWVSIIIADRIGYVKKDKVTLQFLISDQYFKVTNETQPVYDNRSGSLVIVGYLEKGQTYKREKDYTSWHQISFGDFNGYVSKHGTIPINTLHGKTASQLNKTGYFQTTNEKTVYDNSTGKLIPFLTIEKGVTYPIVKRYTSWYEINIAGRTGFVRK